jgi:hypothetical protein
MKLSLAWLLTALLFLLVCSCEPIEPKPVDQRDKFTGKYTVTEQSGAQQVTHTFKVTVTKSAEPDSVIYISNFYNAGLEVYAQVSGSKLSIPFQRRHNYEIEGLGSLNGTELNISYLVRNIHTQYYDECLLKGTRN